MAYKNGGDPNYLQVLGWSSKVVVAHAPAFLLSGAMAQSGPSSPREGTRGWLKLNSLYLGS